MGGMKLWPDSYYKQADTIELYFTTLQVLKALKNYLFELIVEKIIFLLFLPIAGLILSVCLSSFLPNLFLSVSSDQLFIFIDHFIKFSHVIKITVVKFSNVIMIIIIKFVNIINITLIIFINFIEIVVVHFSILIGKFSIEQTVIFYLAFEIW